MEKGYESLSKGKFDSPRDEVLHEMSLEGWSNCSDGNTDAHTGYFSAITITEAELAEITQAFETEIGYAGLVDPSELVGHWLLIDDQNGYVHVRDYETHERLMYDFKRLQEQYEV